MNPDCKYNGKKIGVFGPDMRQAFLEGVQHYTPARFKGCSKLEEEGGVTQVSLSNLRKIRMAFHDPKITGVEFGHDAAFVHFHNGANYVATGFSVGYGGEGPTGFARFLSEAGFGDLRRNLEVIASLDQKFEGDVLARLGKG